ncbi:hypothetical protein M422DRAFT_41449 [Sphaerobolus stellatus SS14]|nr:hypothetical protein M422DRAFT_41449 [Sphaerobolus stellatus SS14]
MLRMVMIVSNQSSPLTMQNNNEILDSHIIFPFKISDGAWSIEDADEEVFLLYSRLQSSQAVPQDAIDIKTSALGSVDSKQGELAVEIIYGPLESVSNEPTSPSVGSKRRKSTAASRKQSQKDRPKSLEITVFQDTTGLRSRKGDTGSVLWRASIHLARYLLSQLHYPSYASSVNTSDLRLCDVIELGSGTGILSIVLAPFVNRFMATDLSYLIPLIHKNQVHNITPQDMPRVSTTELDWVQIQDTPDHLRHKIFNFSRDPTSPSSSPERKHSKRKESNTSKEIPKKDSHLLIVAVDCIFNPALISPLLTTINYLASKGYTRSEESSYTSATVLVVLELRSEDVTREFVEKWLAMPGEWELWNVPFLGPKFAVWIGRRKI